MVETVGWVIQCIGISIHSFVIHDFSLGFSWLIHIAHTIIKSKWIALHIYWSFIAPIHSNFLHIFHCNELRRLIPRMLHISFSIILMGFITLNECWCERFAPTISISMNWFHYSRHRQCVPNLADLFHSSHYSTGSLNESMPDFVELLSDGQLAVNVNQLKNR